MKELGYTVNESLTLEKLQAILSEAYRLDSDIAISAERPSQKRLDHAKTAWKRADDALLKIFEINGVLLDASEKMLVAIESMKHVLEFTHEDTSKEFINGWNAITSAIAKARGE